MSKINLLSNNLMSHKTKDYKIQTKLTRTLNTNKIWISFKLNNYKFLTINNLTMNWIKTTNTMKKCKRKWRCKKIYRSIRITHFLNWNRISLNILKIMTTLMKIMKIQMKIMKILMKKMITKKICKTKNMII